MLDVGLFADLYLLTMMRGYHAEKSASRRAVFELFYRRAPERGGYAVAAGVEEAIDLLERFRFEPQHLEYLRTLGRFDESFLDRLSTLRFTGDVDAVPEGTLIFPHVPILTVEAPLIEAQWVETFLLNQINFASLIATKSSRIVAAARGRPVVEFGLRRAQGYDGGRTASRSAYLGGCDATSNLAAGYEFGVPTVGTHSHGWVMSFNDELQAFRAFCRAYPQDAILLIDTYDTLQSGLTNAVLVAFELEKVGRRLNGVRIDSGDPIELARECRRRLNAAGLDYVKIMASSDLDEYSIDAIVKANAPIDTFGVGTKLATAFQEPAFGGVFKLAAIADERGNWIPKFKLSNDPVKATLPGRKRALRRIVDGRFVGDVLCLKEETAPVDSVSWEKSAGDEGVDLRFGDMVELLEPFMRDGRRVRPRESVFDGRRRLAESSKMLPDQFKAMVVQSSYPVLISKRSAIERDRLYRSSR